MSAVSIKFAGSGLLFVVIFASGLWLSNIGRPLNTAIFTVHKLIAVGTVVFLAVTVYRTNQQAALSATEIAVSVLTALLFLGTIVTGGLLSIENIQDQVPGFVLKLHQVLPFLTTLSSAATLYVLLGGKA